MRKIVVLPVLLALVACTGPTLKRGQAYVSSYAGFSCDSHRLVDSRVVESFGPHGGTVKIVNEFDMTRIDVTEFSPPMEAPWLKPARFMSDVYSAYLERELLPLIRQGAPSARVLGREAREIGGRNVLVSAVLTPGVSPLMHGDGTYADGIRSQVQYTNGRYMYTVTRMGWVDPDRPVGKILESAYGRALDGYASCTFPGPEASGAAVSHTAG